MLEKKSKEKKVLEEKNMPNEAGFDLKSRKPGQVLWSGEEIVDEEASKKTPGIVVWSGERTEEEPGANNGQGKLKRRENREIRNHKKPAGTRRTEESEEGSTEIEQPVRPVWKDASFEEESIRIILMASSERVKLDKLLEETDPQDGKSADVVVMFNPAKSFASVTVSPRSWLYERQGKLLRKIADKFPNTVFKDNHGSRILIIPGVATAQEIMGIVAQKAEIRMKNLMKKSQPQQTERPEKVKPAIKEIKLDSGIDPDDAVKELLNGGKITIG